MLAKMNWTSALRLHSRAKRGIRCAPVSLLCSIKIRIDELVESCQETLRVYRNIGSQPVCYAAIDRVVLENTCEKVLVRSIVATVE